jgi:simple sugar transport system substrate-binding protein
MAFCTCGGRRIAPEKQFESEGSHRMSSPVRQTTSFALLALFSLLAGCSPGPGDRSAQGESHLVLGFSPIVSWGSWNGPNAESVRKAAREAGIELQLEDARHSQEKQVATLRGFVSRHVDVIVFSPVVENGWESVLGEIRNEGIPVILMDRTIEVSDPSLYTSQVGSDFVEEGRRAGRWLLEHTRNEPDEIRIVELRGSVGSAPANDRKLGFAQVISVDPRYHIVRSESAEFDRTRARQVMTDFLKSEGRRIRVLFAHNDGMALGGIEAIEAAGLEPGSDVLVLAIEGSRAGLEAIVAGKLNVSVECSPLLGPQLMAVVRDAADGKPVPRRVVTEESVFTRENAAAALANRTW